MKYLGLIVVSAMVNFTASAFASLQQVSFLRTYSAPCPSVMDRLIGRKLEAPPSRIIDATLVDFKSKEDASFLAQFRNENVRVTLLKPVAGFAATEHHFYKIVGFSYGGSTGEMPQYARFAEVTGVDSPEKQKSLEDLRKKMRNAGVHSIYDRHVGRQNFAEIEERTEQKKFDRPINVTVAKDTTQTFFAGPTGEGSFIGLQFDESFKNKTISLETSAGQRAVLKIDEDMLLLVEHP